MSPNFLVSPQLKEGTNGVRLSACVRVEVEEMRTVSWSQQKQIIVMMFMISSEENCHTLVTSRDRRDGDQDRH